MAHRLNRACRPCAKPSSISSFNHDLSDARTAEDKSPKRNGMNKSAKVVLASIFKQPRRLETVIASAAKQSIAPLKERMDCFVASLLAMTSLQFQTSLHIPAARGARVVHESFGPKKSEGAGNAGRTMHPQPRVRNKKAHEHSHHGHTGTTRHSPRNGFTAYFALSPVTSLL